MRQITNRGRYPNRFRSIKVNGHINGQLIDEVIARINLLRHKSSRPITLFISSRGGEVKSLSRLESFLVPSKPRPTHPKFVTIADNHARSAAALMLIMGNYAYVREHTYLLLHSVRFSDARKLRRVAFADAMAMAMELYRENVRLAVKLAGRMLPRIVRLFLNNDKQSHSPNANLSCDSKEPICVYTQFIRSHLLSPESQNLVNEAYLLTNSLHTCAIPRKSPRTTTTERHWQKQASILQSIFTRRFNSTLAYGHDDAVIMAIMDFLFTQDLVGQRPATITRRLDPDLYQQFQARLTDTKNLTIKRKCRGMRDDPVLEDPTILLKNLWNFTMIISRFLLISDTQIPASDAYWLGLIDGVLTNDLKSHLVLPRRVRVRKAAKSHR